MTDLVTDSEPRVPSMLQRVQRIPLALLPVACGLWSVGIPYAWFLALGGDDSTQPSLSQMLYDEDAPPGKIFMATCMWTSICLLVSLYMFLLPNAQVEHQGKTVCYTLRLVSIVCLGITGMVPGRVDKPVHMGSAFVAFASLVYAEIRILCQHQSLSTDEHTMRSFACAAMLVSMIFFEAHHLEVGDGKWAAWRENWTFRYELGVGSFVVWQIQLIWAYAHQHIYKQSPTRGYVFPWPHCILLPVILVDMKHRGEFTKYPMWQSLLVALGELAIFGFCVQAVYLRFRDQHRQACPATKARGHTYGATDGKCEQARDERVPVTANFA